ncbi:hypothetical protein PoB_002000300 [Plakobranchus ocellatus]|uniref:Uncharacterized protein n=1 Tax=Plakobranchus ocellatus TaxID=259542 RepID=A0AAV3ZFG0_9GAST|nr:hypothetical protein PoB_002000300 [Plakobranchus ocellatus]
MPSRSRKKRASSPASPVRAPSPGGGRRGRSRSRSSSKTTIRSRLPKPLPAEARPPGIRLIKVDPDVAWSRWLDFCGSCKQARGKHQVKWSGRGGVRYGVMV